LQAEVEDLRADYITAKSELMYASKQSEVARKVAPLGLKESLVPPFKIVLKEE
ncbi:MAG: FtsL-like putative cell division protein, partial [Cyclobacteriaceae bacterium]|nr:FtsL-like putative cell division protein [Cyclobacteriaceae bacterium]